MLTYLSKKVEHNKNYKKENYILKKENKRMISEFENYKKFWLLSNIEENNKKTELKITYLDEQ